MVYYIVTFNSQLSMLNLYSHNFFIFCSQHIIDLFDILIVNLLQFFFTTLLCIFCQTVFNGFLQSIDGITASISHTYFSSFTFTFTLQLRLWRSP